VWALYGWSQRAVPRVMASSGQEIGDERAWKSAFGGRHVGAHPAHTDGQSEVTEPEPIAPESPSRRASLAR